MTPAPAKANELPQERLNGHASSQESGCLNIVSFNKSALTAGRLEDSSLMIGHVLDSGQSLPRQRSLNKGTDHLANPIPRH
jgi:hypothetical protein